jgi:Homeodomain-like domain
MNASEREMLVRELRAQGYSQNAIARISGISRRTVGRIIQRLDQSSPSMPARSGAGPQTLNLHSVGQRAGLPLWAMPEPTSQVEPGLSATSATPSDEPSQLPGSPLSEEDQRQDAAASGAETTSVPPSVEALPPITQQLQNVAMKIGQIEAQQLQHVEARTRQAEEALDQALRGVQNVRAEQWKMLREVTQSVGELLQTTGQLLQQLPGKS